jgi:hypothetical protein
MVIGVIRLSTDKNNYLSFGVTVTTTTVPFSIDKLARHFGLVPDEVLLIIDKAGRQIIIQDQWMTFDKNLNYSTVTSPFSTYCQIPPPILIRRPQVRKPSKSLTKPTTTKDTKTTRTKQSAKETQTKQSPLTKDQSEIQSEPIGHKVPPSGLTNTRRSPLTNFEEPTLFSKNPSKSVEAPTGREGNPQASRPLLSAGQVDLYKWTYSWFRSGVSTDTSGNIPVTCLNIPKHIIASLYKKAKRPLAPDPLHPPTAQMMRPASNY